MNATKGFYPGHIYSEEDWNPITLEEAYLNPSNGYRASKKYAEKAAWEFVEKEKPNFTYVLNNVQGISLTSIIFQY
jgi:nucleoside-diphosphate-sugar epimerase